MSMKYPESDWFTDGFVSNFIVILEEAGLKGEAAELGTHLDVKNVLHILQVEYTRLFINAPHRCIAPPFGSVYLESDRSLKAAATERVRDFYRIHGFDIVDTSIIPDEISIELEFLGRLADRGLPREEDEFLSRYFRPWFVEFRDIVTSEAGHPFYPAVVKLIDFFTLQEED